MTPSKASMSGLQRVLVAAGRAVLMLGTLLVVWLGVAASAEADVEPTGAFETSVAIKVPPYHGQEPRLGLAYSSSAPNGWMGALRRHARNPHRPLATLEISFG